jgi:hypothetical protein
MNKPMPIEKLPQYLQDHREIGETGPLVEMGQIIVPKKPYMKWLAACVMFLALGVGSVATYNLMSAKELTYVVDVDTGTDISKIIADSQGQILTVKKTEGSTYEIKAAPRKGKHSFLEWLRKNKDVKKAELEE